MWRWGAHSHDMCHTGRARSPAQAVETCSSSELQLMRLVMVHTHRTAMGRTTGVKPVTCKRRLCSVPAFKKDLVARGSEFMVRFSINYPQFWTPRDRNLSVLITVLPKTRFWSESKLSVSHLLLTNGKKGIVIITNCIVSWLFSP